MRRFRRTAAWLRAALRHSGRARAARAAGIVLVAAALIFVSARWWDDLFGWPSTWGSGGNVFAWVLCGSIAFGWLHAAEKARHLAAMLQAQQHHQEKMAQAEAHHQAQMKCLQDQHTAQIRMLSGSIRAMQQNHAELQQQISDLAAA